MFGSLFFIYGQINGKKYCQHKKDTLQHGHLTLINQYQQICKPNAA